MMAANVLNSPRATDVAIFVVRAFVQLRDLPASNKELARQLKALEARGHNPRTSRPPRHARG